MKTYTGKGIIRINNNEEIQVEYNVQIEFGENSKIKKIEAYLVSPQEAIQKALGVTGTLIMKDGQEFDFFGAEDGRLSPMNYGSALRNF